MAGGLGISQRVALTTIEEWAREVNDEAIRMLPLLALMQAKGRVKQGEASGGGMRWVPRVDEHRLKGFKDMKAIRFTRRNTKVNAFLPWRGYYTDDAISLREKLEQGGPEAFIKVFSNREEVMREGVVRGLAEKFYIDGNSAAAIDNEDIHGIESFMSIDRTAQVGNADEKFAVTHNDNYAGLSTARGALFGPVNDQWTPVVVATDRDPGGGAQLWSGFADQYHRAGLLKATYGPSEMQKPTITVLNRESYEEFLNLLDDKETLFVNRGTGQALASMGFSSIEHDGCAVIWDEACPTQESDGGSDYRVHGYSWALDCVELRLLNGGNLFDSNVTFNDTYQADHIFLYMVGNLKFKSPRRFVKYVDILTAI